LPRILSLCLAGCAISAVEMAPDRADQPWNPATTASGEIVPGEKAPPDRASPGYVFPSNTEVAAVPPPPPGVDLRRTYTLPELIDIAQMNNPLTRTAWNDARKVALLAGIAQSTYLPRITAAAAGAYLTSERNNSATVTAGPVGVGANTSTSSSARGTISAVSCNGCCSISARASRSSRRPSKPR
jgi:outer membrane protein